MKGAQVELIQKGRGFGTVAQRLIANGMDPRALRPWLSEKQQGQAFITINGPAGTTINVPVANATLRKDEWKQYDDVVLKVTEERLVGVGDLIAAGLTHTVNGLAKTVLEYEDQSDIESAQLSMDGATRGRNDRPEFSLNYLPLPIVHADWQLGIRELNASRTTGEALDTSLAGAKTRKVNEKVEEMLFTGASSFAYGGGTLYGYTDFPSANTGNLSAAWDASSTTGATIINDVLAMKQALIADGFYGPYVLYVPTAYETKLDSDYDATTPGTTILERLLKIRNITKVQVADKLTATSGGKERVVLVQMTSDVVRLVEGLPLTPVEWDQQGGMIMDFKIMTIRVPQLRATQEGDCGIAVYTES